MKTIKRSIENLLIFSITLIILIIKTTILVFLCVAVFDDDTRHF